MLRKLLSFGPGRVPTIDPHEALRAAQSGERVLVDVREPDEFAGGHPAGAINVPLSRFRAALDDLPRGPVAISCRSGVRSAQAARIARAAGRQDVASVAGGWTAWTAAGLPTDVRAARARPRP